MYYKAVATFPRAIFLLTVALMTVSLVLLLLVHPATMGEHDAEDGRLNDETQVPGIRVVITREDTLVHIDE